MVTFDSLQIGNYIQDETNNWWDVVGLQRATVTQGQAISVRPINHTNAYGGELVLIGIPITNTTLKQLGFNNPHANRYELRTPLGNIINIIIHSATTIIVDINGSAMPLSLSENSIHKLQNLISVFLGEMIII